MTTPSVAVGAAALGFYLYARRWQQCGYDGVLADLPVLETHARTEQPPVTWSETLYLFREAARYVYGETLGRWHAIDLFFGLAYLSRRATDEYPAADIAAAGTPVWPAALPPAAARRLLDELRLARRLMLACQGLRHHGPEQQRRHWRELAGLEDSDVLVHNPAAGLLRPAYAVLRDRHLRAIVLCVRGTHSRSDMFTSLLGAIKPHHAVTPDGVVLGYSHLGMLAAARWLLGCTLQPLMQALEDNPGFSLKLAGHSMGGGTAAMMTMMLRDKVPELADRVSAWAIACPACMTPQLAAACAPWVTTLVHGADIVPTFSIGAIDTLREEVMRSSWFAEFRSDVRHALRANFSSSLTRLRRGTAEWTQRNIRTAATSLSSCYGRAPRSCYSRVPRKLPTLLPAAASGGQRASAPGGGGGPQQRRRTQGGDGTLQRCDPSDDEADGGADGARTERSPLLPPRARPGAFWRRFGGYGAVQAGGEGAMRVSPSEAALVEKALEACLSAADAGELQLPCGGGAEAQQQEQHQSQRQPADAPCASGGAAPHALGGITGSLAAKAAGFSRAALGKRPAAPGKKDDDEAAPPGGRQLPVSTGAAAAGAGEGGEGGAAADPAAASSTAGKPAPPSLRRRGWAWAGPGGGWAISGGSDGSGGGGRSVVQLLGSTVSHAVMETTGQLLKGAALFQACAAPPAAAAAAAAAMAAAAAAPGGGGGGAATAQHALAAPGSSDDLMCMTRSAGDDEGGGDGPFAARVQRRRTGGSEGRDSIDLDGNSDSDPDLQDDADGDAGSGGGGGDPGLPGGSRRSGGGRPGAEAGRQASLSSLKASISALIAAASSEGGGGPLLRAQQEEAEAAEQLLQEVRTSGPAGGPSLPRLADLGRASPTPLGARGSGRSDGGGGDAQRQQQQQRQQQGADAPADARDRAAERAARRQMVPAGRVLHLLPVSVVSAAHRAAGSPASAQLPPPRQLPRLDAATGSPGLRDPYVLLEVPDPSVYCRMKLCRAMVRDHFIPTHLKGLDSVISQLEDRLGGAGGGGGGCPPEGAGEVLLA